VAESRTDCVRIEAWGWSGLTLNAGNAVVTTAQLLEYAEQAAQLFPDGVVQIDEFVLRVAQETGEGAPRLDVRR
jgi:hypothetical protein